MAPGWSEQDDKRLRSLYGLWDDEAIPVSAIAAALNRTPSAIRYRASKLGLTQPNRPKAKRPLSAPVAVERQCAHCGKGFTPRRPSDPQKSCGRSCAAKQRSVGNRGRFSGRAKTGKRPEIGPMNFRSAWEANYARLLNLWVSTGEIVSWEYEPQVFRFPVKRGNKGYLPDFKVHTTNGDYEWHEVKGYMDDASRIKLNRFALHHPAESIRLVLIDKTAYRALEAEYRHQIAGWE